MAYQITLTDDEYAALSAAAARTGKSVDELAHAAIRRQYTKPATERTDDALAVYMQSQGHLASLASGKGDSPEEEAELEELLRQVGEGLSLSDIVIDDRGPR